MNLRKGFARLVAAMALFAIVTSIGLISGSTTNAQQPPYLAYGVGLTSGDVVAASINGVDCGSATADANGEWVLAIDGATCNASTGDTIDFTLNGEAVTETASYASAGTPVSDGYPAATGIPMTVADTTDPVVTAPADTAVEVAAEGDLATVDLSDASATDDVDGDLTVTNDAQEAGFPVGTTTVTFTATDAAGNVGTATTDVTVTVIDTTAPVVTAPADLSIEVGEGADDVPKINAAITAFLDGVVATDDVDGDIAVTNDAPDVFSVGDTSVTFTATDAAGNVGTATTVVTVTAPAADMGDAPAPADTGSAGLVAEGSTNLWFVMALGALALATLAGGRVVTGRELR